MSDEDSLRNQEIFTFIVNLDYVGDVVTNIMTEFAARKIKQGKSFDPEELEAIAAMHAEVLQSLELGVAIFVRGDKKHRPPTIGPQKTDMGDRKSGN
jgi:phosphate:Na+ symporter